MRIGPIAALPRKILVNQVTYTVRFVKKVDKHDSFGEADPERKTIRLKKDMSKSDLLYTFLHELLHCVEFEYNFRWKHENIHNMEKGLGDLLMANPDLIKWVK